MICIYCLQEKKPSQEHIIPQAFGTFGDKAIIHCVCVDCNNRLGREIDSVLARDTLEGHARTQFGKFSSEKSQPQRVRNVMKEGPLKGFSLVLDQTTNRSQPEAQIKIKHKTTGEEVSMTLWELKQLGDKKNEYNLEPNSIGIVVHRDKKDEVIAELAEIGIFLGERKYDSILNLFGKSEASDEDVIMVPVKNTGRIDSKVMRAISKIIYGFCALQYGDDFVRKSDFDEIRNFIIGKGGTVPGFTPINENDGLADTRPLIKQISVEITPTERGIFGKVTFWGVFSYEILITRGPLVIEPFLFKEVPDL